jgi:hypothetical protein
MLTEGISILKTGLLRSRISKDKLVSILTILPGWLAVPTNTKKILWL